ncbi:MAG: GyrI-like domain-containing protein, partial [Leptospirales bacterium]
HRIFQSLLGENLNQFIRRVRLEKASAAMLANPHRTITDIALDYGFSGSSSFARAFRAHFGQSPSLWKEKRLNSYATEPVQNPQGRRQEKPASPIESAWTLMGRYPGRDSPQMQWTLTRGALTGRITIQNLADMHVAYVRSIGPYKGDAELFRQLFDRLFQWATPHRLLENPATRILTIYHDNPEITEEEYLRISVCMTIPENLQVSGDVGRTILQGGQYAVARFSLKAPEYAIAWQGVYDVWLPESGFLPDDRPSLELYSRDSESAETGENLIDICVPVRKLEP